MLALVGTVAYSLIPVKLLVQQVIIIIIIITLLTCQVCLAEGKPSTNRAHLIDN